MSWLPDLFARSQIYELRSRLSTLESRVSDLVRRVKETTEPQRAELTDNPFLSVCGHCKGKFPDVLALAEHWKAGCPARAPAEGA